LSDYAIADPTYHCASISPGVRLSLYRLNLIDLARLKMNLPFIAATCHRGSPRRR
jgi:hypothetical protein